MVETYLTNMSYASYFGECAPSFCTYSYLERQMQTLKAIDEVITDCSENEAELKGMTYRDLESLLFRLQLRIAQHAVDLIDNYEGKIQILNKDYIQSKRETEENTIEQLHLLREKHFHTIKVYLHYCTELHKNVPLTGITGDIVAKIAQNFYKIFPEDKHQLKYKWKSCDLPLTRTFIQFKPDKSTSFKRNESRRLLIGSENHLL
ncbi:unnamed protein product [Rotaria sp. Silwood1]|nr:unnamed protein product [Rotaria sp. Silwood1]